MICALGMMPSLIFTVAVNADQTEFSGKYLRKRSRYYIIECDVEPELANEIGMHMDAVFKEYYLRLKSYGGKIKERFKVTVFKNKDDYLRAGGVPGSGGVYISNKKTLSAHATGTRESTLRVLYHEGFHQFTDVFLGGNRYLSPWISEGMAQIFEDATWNGKRFEIGEVPTYRVAVLKKARKNRTLIPLDTLVTMSRRTWNENMTDSKMARLQYFEAWSVVYFLVYAKPKYRKALIRYLRLLNQKVGSLESFSKAFGSNIKSFEARWLEYLDKLKPSPKFVCRKNLHAMGWFIAYAARTPKNLADFPSFATYFRQAFERGAFFKSYGEEKISSKTPERIEAILRCPLKISPKSKNYVIKSKQDAKDSAERITETMIQCELHKGIMLNVRCVKSSPGKFRSVVEEIISRGPMKQ